MNSQAPTQYVAGKIYQGLRAYGPNLKPQPELARSWKVSSDGLTYIAPGETLSGIREAAYARQQSATPSD